MNQKQCWRILPHTINKKPQLFLKSVFCPTLNIQTVHQALAALMSMTHGIGYHIFTNQNSRYLKASIVLQLYNKTNATNPVWFTYFYFSLAAFPLQNIASLTASVSPHGTLYYLCISSSTMLDKRRKKCFNTGDQGKKLSLLFLQLVLFRAHSIS